MNKRYIGVDLGGTSIKMGIVSGAGELSRQAEGPTHREEGAEAVVARIAGMARDLAREAGVAWDDVAGIGVGIPGFMNIAAGVVRMAPNLQWKDVPARAWLEAHLGKPVRLDNDANAAALGEAWSGAGAGKRHMVCVTLGTGVGGGIIADGRIFEGAYGTAGEIGHIPLVTGPGAVRCGCGKIGCLETVASATGIVRLAREKATAGAATSLPAPEAITARDVFAAAASGDALAAEVVAEAMDTLGRALAMIAVTINPERFVIGGGVSRAGKTLFAPLREAFLRYTPEAAAEGVDIVAAALGNDAGTIGAAGLVARNQA